MTRYWRGEHDTSPRTRIVHALNVTILLDRNQNRTLRSTNLEVLRDGDFKLVVGKQEAASWFGAFAPVVNESLLPMLNELDRRRQALSYLEAHLSSLSSVVGDPDSDETRAECRTPLSLGTRRCEKRARAVLRRASSTSPRTPSKGTTCRLRCQIR